jgi:enoyl-CoA hydratase/carnithine racemase
VYETILYGVESRIATDHAESFGEAQRDPAAAPVPNFMSLWRSPKPVIAQVHGWCIGGVSELALCADIVVAADVGSQASASKAQGAIG